jgi:hypothetical protein
VEEKTLVVERIRKTHGSCGTWAVRRARTTDADLMQKTGGVRVGLLLIGTFGKNSS